MEERYLICFEKEISKTDVTGNLEIPRDALYLPDAAENNEIMLVWDNGKIWNFKAPMWGDGTGSKEDSRNEEESRTDICLFINHHNQYTSVKIICSVYNKLIHST
ncbi:hypothetical protein CsSME_00028416 [Camellia sinensis var. sinensis]